MVVRVQNSADDGLRADQLPYAFKKIAFAVVAFLRHHGTVQA
jgi:hypothetical protein